MKLQQYSRYVIVGSLIGIAAIVFRDVLGRLLPDDNSVWYLTSVAVTYALAICASFTLQKLITFKPAVTADGKRTFVFFTLVAISGGLSTLALSSLFRYQLGFEPLFGAYAGSAAFALAAFLSSLLTYWLHKHAVFKV